MEEITQGIRVRSVLKNMPAHLGGLQRNDIIVRYNGKKVNNVNEFKMWIADSQVGKNSRITVLRDGHERTFTVTIAEMPSLQAGRTVENNSVAWNRLGLTVRKLEKGDAERYTYLTDEDRGVIVDMVEEMSPIARGSLIIAVNGKSIRSAQDLDALLQMEQDLEEVIIEVKNSYGTEKITVKLKN